MENNRQANISERTALAQLLAESGAGLTGSIILITPEAVETVAEKIYELAKRSVLNELSTLQQEEPLITQDEAAKLLGKCKNTLWKWRKKGYIEGVTVGKEVKYKASQIQAILNGTKVINEEKAEQ